jgi:hypothetical protein
MAKGLALAPQTINPLTGHAEIVTHAVLYMNISGEMIYAAPSVAPINVSAGLSGGVSASYLGDTYLNDSGVSITKLTPVAITSAGGIKSVGVAVEAESLGCIGIAFADINNTASGIIITNGRLVTSGTSFALASILYVAKTGGLTDSKPSIGVAGFVSGDWVIRIGAVAKNLTNPAAKDILVNVSVIGQL